LKKILKGTSYGNEKVRRLENKEIDERMVQEINRMMKDKWRDI
jgi:hypothetical protein